MVYYKDKVFMVMLLCLLALPFSVAGQNIALGLAALVLGYQLFQQRKSVGPIWGSLPKSVLWVSAWYCLWIAFMLLSALANSNLSAWLEFLPGYLGLLLLPLFCIGVSKKVFQLWPTVFVRVLTGLIFLFGILALSQYIWGWAIVPVSSDWSAQRARAFYSHPLTFGYVLILLAPVVLYASSQNLKRLTGIGLLGAYLLAVGAVQSKTVLLVTVSGICIWFLCQGWSHRRLLILGSSLVAAMLVLSLFDNPFKSTVLQLVNRTFETQSDYPFDRMVFWDAHWHLFKAQPLLGYGPNIGEVTLQQAYADIGMSDFEKQYSAHNTPLQIAVEGGVIGLGIWLLWFGSLLKLCWSNSAGRLLFTGLAMWFIASLTQNSFHDSEVRYTLMLVVCAAFLIHTHSTTLHREVD